MSVNHWHPKPALNPETCLSHPNAINVPEHIEIYPFQIPEHCRIVVQIGTKGIRIARA
jgi:hypothetical protein